MRYSLYRVKQCTNNDLIHFTYNNVIFLPKVMQNTLLAVLKVQFTDRFAIKFTASNAIFGPTVMQCKVLIVKQCSVLTVRGAIPNKNGPNSENVKRGVIFTKHFIFRWSLGQLLVLIYNLAY